MNRNIVYAGFLTGVAIIATLFYPLYVVLPGGYVTGWRTGSEGLALILTIVTAVIIVVGGMLATRWGGSVTWHTGAELGAVAGGIAGMMAFAALGAAAAGTVSLGNTLLSETEGSTLDAVIQTANLTYAALWGMLLWGAALGALGGLAAPPVSSGEKQEDESAIRIAEVLSNRLLLVSLLILVVSAGTTPMLIGSENLDLQEGLDVVFNQAVGSGFVVTLAVQFWILHLALRRLVPGQAILRKRQVKGGLWFASWLSILAMIVMVILCLALIKSGCRSFPDDSRITKVC